MSLPGYGVPTPEMIHGALLPRFRMIEQHCRDWCERPSRQSLRPLVTALGGMALLARLCGQPASGEHARRALRRLRGQTGGQGRASVVVHCLVMLDGWAERTVMERHGQSGLVLLRAAALGALRLQEAGEEDGADEEREALPGTVLQYLALRDCLTGRRSRVRSAASACRALLDDEADLERIPRRFAGDMALSLDAPLSGLGTGAQSPDRMRKALYAVYRELSVLDAAHRLCCLALPAQAVRQAQWMIVMHLRQHPGDWPAHSRAVLVRHLLVLQCWLMAGPERVAVDLSPVMRRTGRFLREWRQTPGPGEEVAPWLDAALRQRIAVELREELSTLTRELPARQDRPVSPVLCTALARLHLTLHLTGYRLLAWWSDSLQQSLLTQLQVGHVAEPVWRQRLLQFRGAVLDGPVRAVGTERGSGSERRKGTVPDAAMTLDHGRAVLDAVTDEARLLAALRHRAAPAIPMTRSDVENHDRAGVREPVLQIARQTAIETSGETVSETARETERTVIDQLSGGMTCLPDPAAWFRALEEEGASVRQAGLMRAVSRELEVLEKGARALGVPRIEALAAVLRSVYRQIGVAGGQGDPVPRANRSLLVALRRGHAGLLHRLDQAAAWQSISRPQPVIEYLYRCLEEQQSGQPRGGLSLPQRCLSINRRLQALLDAAPPASVSGDRRTLMLTLMRDQARLLRTLAVPHRNRPDQGV